MPSAASPLPCFGAAYIRVSTDDQAELSPETQLEEIRKYAQREGIILLQEQIYIDSGISGKTPIGVYWFIMLIYMVSP